MIDFVHSARHGVRLFRLFLFGGALSYSWVSVRPCPLLRGSGLYPRLYPIDISGVGSLPAPLRVPRAGVPLSTIHEAHAQGNPLPSTPIPVPVPCPFWALAFRPRFCPDPRALRWVRAAPGMPRGHSGLHTSSPKIIAILMPILAFGRFSLPIRELKIPAQWDFGDFLAHLDVPMSHARPRPAFPWLRAMGRASARRQRRGEPTRSPMGARCRPGEPGPTEEQRNSGRAGLAPPATLRGSVAIISWAAWSAGRARPGGSRRRHTMSTLGPVRRTPAVGRAPGAVAARAGAGPRGASGSGPRPWPGDGADCRDRRRPGRH